MTDENPGPKRERKQANHGFFAPLDIIDGMARIYHPIAEGVGDEGKTPYAGVFLKDYVPDRGRGNGVPRAVIRKPMVR